MGLSTIQKTQKYGGATPPCIVYWGTTDLKDEYVPHKIVIKIVIFAKFRTVLLLSNSIAKNSNFSRYLIGGGNVLQNFEFIKS